MMPSRCAMADNVRMTSQRADEILMQRALTLAGQALYITSPNPRVGCVIADPQGRVLGEGHTQTAGQAHAEIMALKAAQQDRKSTRLNSSHT